MYKRQLLGHNHKVFQKSIKKFISKKISNIAAPNINAEIFAKNIKKVVICSGKVFYNLYEEREKRKLDDVKLLRLEQIYPFPSSSLKEI